MQEGIQEADRGETTPWNTAEIIEKARFYDLDAIRDALAQWVSLKWLREGIGWPAITLRDLKSSS